jgi:hypothetical protein
MLAYQQSTYNKHAYYFLVLAAARQVLFCTSGVHRLPLVLGGSPLARRMPGKLG